MNNKIIEQQLNKCEFADLSTYFKENNTYFIPKYTKPLYHLNMCYLVQVSKNALTDTKSVMAINWNKGQIPTAEYLKIYVTNIIGKNIYVDGKEYDYVNKQDLNNMWSGWLNVDDLTQLEIL